MLRKQFVRMLCVVTVLGLLTACTAIQGPRPGAERHPFSVHSASEDGAEFSWEAYSDGYRPGTTEMMRVAVKATLQPWTGSFCLLLLEPLPSAAVIPLAIRDFYTGPGMWKEWDVDVDLPADLETGTYGLALVVHKPGGPVASVVPIWVGEGQREPFAGEWPTKAALAACPAPFSLHEGFEQGLADWEQGSHVPDDPESLGQPVFWRIEASTEQAAEGQSSARFMLDGRQAEGTIWLMRALDVPADAAVQINLAFDLWSEDESFNLLANVAAYAGPGRPVVEEDFVTEPANQVAGWKTYTYEFHLRSTAEGRAWVALGISAVWETQLNYYVDNVRVRVTRTGQGELAGERIIVQGVEVSARQVVVHGTSTLPDGSAVSSELWAAGSLQDWWPMDQSATVQDGQWSLMVLLPPGKALRPGVQYMLRAYQPGGPNVVSVFPFELGETALPGTGQAPLKAVETHVLAVADREGVRRAFDLYVAAPDADQLASLEAVLLRALASMQLG